MLRYLPTLAPTVLWLPLQTAEAYPIEEEITRLMEPDTAVFVSISSDPCGLPLDGNRLVCDGGGLEDVTAAQRQLLSSVSSVDELINVWNREKSSRPAYLTTGDSWIAVQIHGLDQGCTLPVPAPDPWGSMVPGGTYDGHDGLVEMFATSGIPLTVQQHQGINNRQWQVPDGGAPLRDVLTSYTVPASKGFRSVTSARIAAFPDGSYRTFVSVRNIPLAPFGQLAVSSDPETAEVQTAKIQLDSLREWVESGEYLKHPKMRHYPELLAEEQAELQQLEEEYLLTHDELPYDELPY